MVTKGKSPGVRTKLFVANETIGVGKVKLLQLVKDTGSIIIAAQKMGMSYRRACFLLGSMQSGFANPLFETEHGGKTYESTKLTALGVELLNRYAAHANLVAGQSSDILDWLRSVQSQPSISAIDEFEKQ